jgi:hypothetical protein
MRAVSLKRSRVSHRRQNLSHCIRPPDRPAPGRRAHVHETLTLPLRKLNPRSQAIRTFFTSGIIPYCWKGDEAERVRPGDDDGAHEALASNWRSSLCWKPWGNGGTGDAAAPARMRRRRSQPLDRSQAPSGGDRFPAHADGGRYAISGHDCRQRWNSVGGWSSGYRLADDDGTEPTAQDRCAGNDWS